MEFMDLSKPEYSYMFGFLQTDGTLTQGKGLKGRVSVEIQRRDEPILHEFRRLTPYNSSVGRRTRTTNFKVGYESSVVGRSAKCGPLLAGQRWHRARTQAIDGGLDSGVDPSCGDAAWKRNKAVDSRAGRGRPGQFRSRCGADPGPR